MNITWSFTANGCEAIVTDLIVGESKCGITVDSVEPQVGIGYRKVLTRNRVKSLSAFDKGGRM